MNGRSLLYSCLGLILVLAPVVSADEPPPFMADPISLTRWSPSVMGFGNTPGDIYGEVPLGGMIGMGWDVGGPGPIPHVWDVNYGLIPPGPGGLPPGDNNNGHSNGEQFPDAPIVIYFSGDDLSLGVPGTHYNHQAIRMQAAGDRFVTNGFTWFTPFQVLAGAPQNAIVGPLLPGPINLLSANQTRYNEIPSISQLMFNAFVPPAGATPMDDMDALELTPFDLDGDNVHDTFIYYCLDGMSPSLPPIGASSADVLVAVPGQPPIGIFAPAPSLGLNPQADELDALAVWDSGAIGMVDPGLDIALFSLAPGSMYLDGPDGIPGTADDLSPADIFVTDFTGFNLLYMSANALGMLFTDNIDALDVEMFQGDWSIEIWDEIPEEMPGDVDGNGVVDGLDLTAVISAFGTVPGDLLWNPAADLDDNGVVDGLDLTEVISNWTFAAAAEPESAKPGKRLGNVRKGSGNAK